MEADASTPAELLRAIHFAADKHRDQKRKGADASPYINHPIEVAELLARIGGVGDLVSLQSAVLHDTVEDTEATLEELDEHFGPDVAALVAEMSDDKSLPKQERKRLQVEHAPQLSRAAKEIKLADKICNVRDIRHDPPEKWDLKRRLEYLDWTAEVVEGCRGTNAPLEDRYDEILREARGALAKER